MPTINDYKVWANRNQVSAIALNGESNGLVKESERMGKFARTFKRGTLATMRKATIADFTRALGERYGTTIAQQAVSMTGIEPGSRLRGWKIAQAIQAAKNLRAQALQPGGAARDMKIGGTDVPAEVVDMFLADKTNAVAKFLKQRAVAVQLLGEMPLTQEDCDDFRARAENLASRLARLGAAAATNPGFLPGGVPPADFRAAVDGLVNAIYDKIAQMRELTQGSPLGATGVREYKDVWRDAAVNALAKLAGKAAAAGKPRAAQAISSAAALLRSDAATRAGLDAAAQPARDAAKKSVAPFLERLVKRQLRSEGVRNFKIDAAALARKATEGFLDALNTRRWATVEKTMATTVAGRPVTLKSTIAPAENLGRSPQSPRGPIASRYPAAIHGYSCNSSKADHAVNLSVSSISAGETGGAQTVAFAGVRHTVHSAWGIRNAADRAAANAKRAEEAVIAAFLLKFDSPEGADALPGPDEDGTTTVDLKMASVALLTPDAGRHAVIKGSSHDERQMLADQNAAWDAVMRDGVTFQFKGRQIRIKPQILKFNFGVNEGAVNKTFKLMPKLAGGWDVSSRMNRTAFAALKEDVEAFIAQNGDSKAARAARTLLDQCRRALEARAERSDSHDAYKAAARIAVLCHLVGKTPCWNCKSGKDRTGQMDVECKFLATLIACGAPIPEPGAPLDEDQKKLFRSIALQGGNFEIQKMNTGLAGFRSGKVASIAERLGSKEYSDFHRGGSSLV